MSAFKDLRGMQFGRLVVISLLDRKSVNGGRFWECHCDCGNITNVGSTNLISGGTKSCGCIQKVNPDRQSKECPDCHKDLPITDYGNRRGTVDGKQYSCRQCRASKALEEHYKRDEEGKVKYRKLHNANHSRRYSSDIRYRIEKLIRGRIHMALKRNSKSLPTTELIGTSIDKLKEYIERKFDENMSWENQGSYWHIDHIKPCAVFDLTQEEEQRKCFHYTNLQPLEKHENMRKGAKYEEN